MRFGGFALALVALSLASSASAQTTRTFGLTSAVERIHRTAGFDEIVRGTDLNDYTEDGLVVDTADTSFAVGEHYANGGSTEPTQIRTADGAKLVALELEGYRVSEVPGKTLVYWEVIDAGEVIASGADTIPYSSFIGFVDPEGFDELRIMAHFSLSEIQRIAAVGFENAGSFNNSLTTSNVVAEVGRDLDGDGPIGRFDNCPETANPSQGDRDGDGIGDACDDFPDGGSELMVCEEELASCLDDPPFLDADGDGEHDATDACPDSAPGELVDARGCTLTQFCAAIEVSDRRDKPACILADWRQDEAGARPADCSLEKSSGSCVPARRSSR